MHLQCQELHVKVTITVILINTESRHYVTVTELYIMTLNLNYDNDSLSRGLRVSLEFKNRDLLHHA